MSEVHTIRVKKGDIEIEIAGPREYVDAKFVELEARYLAQATVPPTREAGTPAPPVEPVEIPDNLPTFLIQKGEPKGQDLVFACTEWLMLQKKEPFEPKDIATCISETRYDVPRNIPRDLDRLVKKGHLINPERGKYKVSKPGLDALSKMGQAG